MIQSTLNGTFYIYNGSDVAILLLLFVFILILTIWSDECDYNGKKDKTKNLMQRSEEN